MSDINAPIQIPSELNVPETNSDNETEQSDTIKSSSAASVAAHKTQSAESSHDRKSLPKHRLRASAKSQSMFTFPTSSLPINEEIHSEKQTNPDVSMPTITLSPASARFSNDGNPSTSSVDRSIENKLMGDPIENPNELNPNEARLSANRKRVNSLPVSVTDQHAHNEDEFDELEPHNVRGSQLRIRSSIISLFGRMGKMRRTSNNSQNSNHENGDANGVNIEQKRTLPQIAASKILRAFSYVGKNEIEKKIEIFTDRIINLNIRRIAISYSAYFHFPIN